MLIGIKADYIEIEKNGEKDESEKEKIKKENIILGIYNKSLTKRGEYRAIVGMEFV